MANTDTSVNAGKPTGASSAAEGAKNGAGDTPNTARVEAQAGDPYRPDGGNDYSLAIDPEDTGEATIANLYQAVPLEHEGSGAAQQDGAGTGGDGGDGPGAKAGGLGKGQGDGQGDTLLPDGATDVVETADGAPDDDAGLGDGAVPDARGLDATLPQFNLGGDGIRANGSQVGDGTNGGVAPEDDDNGGDGGSNADIGPVSDSDEILNEVSEFASGGEYTGVTAFADDPDVSDFVSYEITGGDGRFVIDPETGEIIVREGSSFDAETERSVDVEVTATSTDGSTSSGTFTITIGDENEAPIGPVSDSDEIGNEVSEFATGGEYSGVTAFADDPDVTDVVSYEITGGDDRFEIDPETGEIFVKDGSAFDAETEQSVDVEVTATSTDGSTSTGTFTIAIGDENEAPIGPVSDSDTTGNAVSEFATGGEYSGVTAFADDPDVTDVVSYEITGGGDRFEIDPETGVITVADGASFDHESEPSVDVEVTATSTDGSTATGTFTIDITDENEPPDLVVCLENGSVQFVVNGSFEQFEGALSGTDPKGYFENPTSIEGWSYQDVDVQQAARWGTGASDGDHRLDLSANQNGTASQQIDGMLEGQVYTFSFDSAPRGPAGETVAEVYWNGELIDTIDPAEAGAGWNTYSYNIVGGSGDGTNTLTFVEVGGKNASFGTFIDNVSIVSDNRIAVVEEFHGAEIAPLQVFDPDVGDTHTFTVSDERFEVVVADGKYVLKLKDDQAFDYETETQVTVDVTATDSGGLSDTETVVIDVLDIDENLGPIGPVTDSDTALNTVAENGAGGEYVGVMAHANDPDSGDTVTYSITDDRFDIDPDTGVITVKDGVSFDHEALPTVDIEVTATSSDGSSSTGTFTVNITDVNEAPDLDFDPELGPGTAVTLTFVEEQAGYSNALGVFYMDGNGQPAGGEIVWVNQNDLAPGDTASVYLEGVEAAEIGYFLIPDGADYNTLASGDEVTFQKDGDGNWQAVLNGTPLVGKDANVFFSGDGSLNPDGYDYTVESGVTIGFEDIAGGGDEDFDDVVFDQTSQETNANAAVYEEELGAEVGSLSVFDPDVGDTHTFTVSDDRFEVVAQNGDYVLKLKDDQKLDYETETQVTVEVTATDTGGLSDTETIVIDVIDIEPEDPVYNNGPVGPVRDSDTSQNLVAATAAAGMVVGLTAFAQDADADDTVTYDIDDDRFDIDADTGVVTVASGSTLTAGETINVTVTATSSDGSQSSAVFPVEVTSGGSDNAPPDLIVGAAIYQPETRGGRHEDDDDGKDGSHHHGRHREDDDDEGRDDDDCPPKHGDDDTGFMVPENEAGVELVELSVVDPDTDDSHTFTVSDERFEVVSDGESYLLKLKDDVAVDFETEQSITLDVTATDSGGLSDTETITLDVVDQDDGRVMEYGSRDDDILVGGDANDRLKGRDGDDTLIGQGGNDRLFGNDGDDILRGGTGDDVMKGGDGSDLFAYMLGDGSDEVYGGAGGNWIDIVDLSSNPNGGDLGDYGSDWSITMTEGSIEQVDPLSGEISLSPDAGGYIELADGGRVDFSDLEAIQY